MFAKRFRAQRLGCARGGLFCTTPQFVVVSEFRYQIEELERRRLLSADLSGFVNAFADDLAPLHDKVRDALNAASKVPFLNQQLGGLQAADVFASTVINNLKSAINGSPFADPSKTDPVRAAALHDAIFTALGPGGAGIVASSGDVSDTVDSTDGGSVSVTLKLSRHFDGDLPLSFGLGLPGIPLNVTTTGGIHATLDLSDSGLNFTFANKSVSSFNPGTLQVQADAKFKSGTSLEGTFGFLKATVTDTNPDHPTGSEFQGTFTVGNLTGSPTFSLSGNADVHVHMALGAGAQFPGLASDLNVHWPFTTTNSPAPDVSLDHASITLGTFFSDIVKPVLSDIQSITKPIEPLIDFLKARIPVLSDGTEALGIGPVSIESLVKVVTPELPPDWQTVIRLATTIIDVTKVINDTNLAGSNVAIDFGGFSLSSLNGDLRSAPAVDFSKLSDFGVNITDLQTPQGFGFDINQVAAQVAAKLGENAPETFGIKKFIDDFALSAQNEVKLDFPIIDNPEACVFKLLVGQDADFARFNVQFHLPAKFSSDSGFSLFGYGIKFEGRILLDTSFKMAYDSFGLREFLGDPSKPQKLLDGFYIDTGSHFHITGDPAIVASLNVSAGIVGVTVSGGITKANLTLDLNKDADTNHDGKLRLATELDPKCLFDVAGEVQAGFHINVHVGVTIPNPFGDDVFVGVSHDLGGADVTVFKFDNADADGCLGPGSGPVPPPPVLATVDPATGVMTLLMGPHAGERQNVGDTTDGDENFTVTHVGGTAGDEALAVTAFGYTQTAGLEHVKSIYADGGQGNDTVLVDAAVLDPAELHGGIGNDTLTYFGTGVANISGDDGDDVLSGGTNADTIAGGAGKDLIKGGNGNDNLDGGADDDTILGGNGDDTETGDGGNDSLSGDAGADHLIGGDGDDQLDGGTENDNLEGGAGDDVMLGQSGDDSLSGGNDNDAMIGGTGKDTLDGGDGNDVMAGDDATLAGGDPTKGPLGSVGAGGDDDQLFGRAGNDTMFGQGGNDLMDGGADNDAMYGGDGADQMAGNAGNDSMSGGAGDDTMAGDGQVSGNTLDFTPQPTDGNDTMNGDEGNDAMYGLGGSDTMHGNANDDTMSGGDGNDTMFGDDGNDTMTGDAGADTMDGGNNDDVMQGNADNDTMNGGAGNDNMQGNDGDDLMHGNAGDDHMEGNAGNDTMFGDEDNDNMQGNDGDDQMHGNAGNDTMFGNAGNDTMTGDDGDDYMEGNQGSDNMQGGNNDDDMIGGSSVPAVQDAGDTMDGGDGHDVMLGDNGTITRTGGRATAGVPFGTGVGLEDNAPIRSVTLSEDDGTTGNDTMTGGTGDDQMWGENGDDNMAGNDGNDAMIGGLGADTMDGGAGNDGMLGDRGSLVDAKGPPNVAGDLLDGSNQQTIGAQDSKVSATIYLAGSILWSATPVETTSDGNDVMTGGLGEDSVHGGGGADTIRGDAPNGTVGGFADGSVDKLFGDSGNDVILGDGGADHLFGGSGDDKLDGGAGADIAYGGDGQDTLTADVADDRLIDWFGNFNQFNVPGPGFGAQTIIRTPNPQMQNFLTLLGTGDGATNSNGELQVVVPPSPSNAGPGPGH
jgi:Ca2+-binding RTX toxin-like protein